MDADAGATAPLAGSSAGIPNSAQTLGPEMGVDAGKATIPSSENSRSIPTSVEKIMDSAGISGNLEILILAVNGVFLKSGFVVCDDEAKDRSLAIHYTLPEPSARVAALKFSALRNQVMVYGSVIGEQPYVHRLHFDLSRLLPLFCQAENEEANKELFGFRERVMDRLCMPLLINVCHKRRQELAANSPEKSFSVTRFLKSIMESEKEGINGNLGRRLVVAVHAVFLESGFVVCNDGVGDGSRLPKDWHLSTGLLSVHYTAPELLNRIQGVGVAAALRFSVLRNQAVVYGSVAGEAEIYQLHLDMAEVLPLLVFPSGETKGDEEKVVLRFWRTVKDRLCLPLMIDVCHKNVLALPPCFAGLPTDLKLKVLELLPAADIARVGCTGSEMRHVASNEQLWRQKFFEEFGWEFLVVDWGPWKEKFGQRWVARKEAKVRRDKRRRILAQTPFPRAPRRFPLVIGGGDHDLFPQVGNHDPLNIVGNPFNDVHHVFPQIGHLLNGVLPANGANPMPIALPGQWWP